METTKSKVKFCPFCGHHGHQLLYDTAKVRYEDGETEIQDIWQMECKCCGARGPTEYTPEFAIDSWNMLYWHPAHNDDPVEEEFSYNADLIKTKEHENGKKENS